MVTDGLLDTTQAAKLLNVPKQYIYQHPEIPRCRLGKRTLRFDPEELLNWVKRHRAQGVEPCASSADCLSKQKTSWATVGST